MSRTSGSADQRSKDHSGDGMGAAGMGAPRPRVHRASSARAVRFLGTLVLAATFGFVSIESAEAECSMNDAKRKAESSYGGTALSVSVDGDYLVVRLRLRDGQIIYVSIPRWSC